MAGVSAESNALFIAFRRLVYSFSEQVSKDEQQAMIYIRLYKLRERYKDSTTLEVLSRLEADGVFGPSNPEGLLEIAKDIKRQDLASEVKDYIKKRSKSEKKGGLSSSKKVQPPVVEHQYGDTEEDLQLRATIEVTLAQATVLMQQVEILERAVAEGKAQRQRAKEAISEAGQTAAALADRLRKAQIELGLGTEATLNAVGPAASARGEGMGVVSHSTPIGVSGKYALQPHPRQLGRIPEQSTEFNKKSNTNSGPIIEEEEDDDYEKMQSGVVQEETIKAWRMSHISNASNYGSFTPPSLQSRRSEHFGSCPSSTPQMPTIQPRSELHLPYAPGSPHNVHSSASHYPQPGSNQKRSSVMPSTSVPQTTDSRLPWLRGHAHNLNTNNSSGNTTLTSPHSTQGVHKSPQRPIQGSVAPPLVPRQQTTTSAAAEDVVDDKDSILKRVTRTPPPQLPPRSKASASPVNKSPVPTKKRDSPTLSKRVSHTSAAAGGSSTVETEPVTKSSKEVRCRHTDDSELGKVSLVKARLQRLEKTTSTLKPALSPKPKPVITPRKKVSGCRTLDHNSSLQKELNKKQSTATLPHSISSSSLKQFSLSQLSNASQSSCNEDDAYILLHPSGTSASTLNTGDSGFEDVRPLQRLDQEPENEGDSSESVVPTHNGAYTSLLDQRSAIPDHDGYTAVSYRPEPHGLM